MKCRVIAPFYDIVNSCDREIGDVIELDKERADALIEKGLVSVESVMSERKPAAKPAAARRKREVAVRPPAPEVADG